MRILAALLLAVLIAGCASQQSNVVTTTTVQEGMQSNSEIKVVIRDFAFTPQVLTIKSGSTVTWTNEDSAPHIVASNPHPTHTDLPGFESKRLSKGESYSYTFTQTGTFGYHCHLHPSMTGQIIVE
ncbi:MAG: copper-binding protein [Candidatus Altiarchaeales archaeon]|nr:copper-binding protein [Candidatus Altiarchaeales archaeon]